MRIVPNLEEFTEIAATRRVISVYAKLLADDLTPIGASANITGIGILRKEGCEVTSRDFFRIGIPFTLAAVATGYLLIWFLWG